MTSLVDDDTSSLTVLDALWGREMAVLSELSARSGVAADVAAKVKPVAAVLTRHLGKNRRDTAIASAVERTFVLPDADYEARHPTRPLAVYNSFLDVTEASLASLSRHGPLEVALIEALAANNPLFSPVILAPELTVPALSAFYGPGNPRSLNSVDYHLLRRRKGLFGFFVKAAELAILGSHIGLAAKLAAQDASSDTRREVRGIETIYNLTV